MTLGERISSLRKQAGYTRNEFADRLDMSANTLRNYELDIHEPGHSFLIKIAKIFGVTVDYLLGIESDTKKSPTPAAAEVEDDLLIDLFYTLFVEAGYIKNGDELTLRQGEMVAAMIHLVRAMFAVDDRQAAG